MRSNFFVFPTASVFGRQQQYSFNSYRIMNGLVATKLNGESLPFISAAATAVGFCFDFIIIKAT